MNVLNDNLGEGPERGKGKGDVSSMDESEISFRGLYITKGGKSHRKN